MRMISLAVFIIAGSIIGGIIIGKAVVEPQVIVEQVTIRTSEYEQLPPEIIYRYFRVPVRIEPKPFNGENELTLFLNDYDGNAKLVWENLFQGGNNDCDDFAFRLRDYAIEKGKLIETEAFSKGEWDGQEHMKENHLVCKTFISNDVYIIDPFTLEYWVRWQVD